MNQTQKRRLTIVAVVAVSAALAVSLAVYALQQNMNYLLTPSQVQSGQAAGYKTFRLGGMVKRGSIHRSDNSLKTTFIVIDADGAMPVEYTGILPDLFRDDQSVIATGHLDHAEFVATEVLAKHDETYMPKELKDAMAKAHANKNIKAAAGAEAGAGHVNP